MSQSCPLCRKKFGIEACRIQLQCGHHLCTICANEALYTDRMLCLGCFKWTDVTEQLRSAVRLSQNLPLDQIIYRRVMGKISSADIKWLSSATYKKVEEFVALRKLDQTPFALKAKTPTTSRLATIENTSTCPPRKDILKWLRLSETKSASYVRLGNWWPEYLTYSNSLITATCCGDFGDELKLPSEQYTKVVLNALRFGLPRRKIDPTRFDMNLHIDELCRAIELRIDDADLIPFDYIAQENRVRILIAIAVNAPDQALACLSKAKLSAHDAMSVYINIIDMHPNVVTNMRLGEISSASNDFNDDDVFTLVWRAIRKDSKLAAKAVIMLSDENRFKIVRKLIEHHQLSIKDIRISPHYIPAIRKILYEEFNRIYSYQQHDI